MDRCRQLGVAAIGCLPARLSVHLSAHLSVRLFTQISAQIPAQISAHSRRNRRRVLSCTHPDLSTNISMKPACVKNLSTLCMGGLIFAAPGPAALAVECTQNWEHPISQQIEMRGMSLSLEEYANNERHFSIRQANHVLDIYFLQDALLIKGPPLAEIEQYSEEELSWFPMAFAIPNAILSSMSPKGPCSIKNKTQFSRPLSGVLGFGAHKLTFAEGKLIPSGPGKVAYTFAATVSPPA